MDEDLSVLVVDDVPASRRVIRRLLSQLGIKSVSEAGNGEDALKLLTSPQQFQLLITDLNLGSMTGIELINSMKSEERLRSVPTIIITSDADRQTVIAALKHGVTSFLLKPFNSTVLKEKIDEALTRVQQPAAG